MITRKFATCVLPTGGYVNVFGDILNKLVILTLDCEAFKSFLLECLPTVTDQEIISA